MESQVVLLSYKLNRSADPQPPVPRPQAPGPRRRTLAWSTSVTNRWRSGKIVVNRSQSATRIDYCHFGRNLSGISTSLCNLVCDDHCFGKASTLPNFDLPKRSKTFLTRLYSVSGIFKRTESPNLDNKRATVTFWAVLPDGSKKTFDCKSGEKLWDVIEDIVVENNIGIPLVLMDGGLIKDGSVVDILDNSSIHIIDDHQPNNNNDDDEYEKLQIITRLLDTEKEYLRTIKAIPIAYGIPLRKLCTLSIEDHKLLFDWIEPISSIASMLITKLETCIGCWSPDDTCIGSFFSKQLWKQYEEYHKSYTTNIQRLLKDKYEDEEFVEFCHTRKKSTKYDINCLLRLPVDRSRDYNQYLKEILAQTDSKHQDHSDLRKALASSSEMVQSLDHNQAMTDIDRIQELFPNDDLGLHELDPSITKSKQIHRSRSITANRLQRAFSAKNKLTSPDREPENKYVRTLHRRSRSVGGNKIGCNRKFLMDGPVHLTSGVQSQDRHFFLFNDVLLVAKPRSSGNYKLKSRVRVSELWLSDCIDDVTEVLKSRDTSFVVGWPMGNYVASFSTAQAKNVWLEKLRELLSEEKKNDSTATTTIHISFYHYIQENDTLKLVTVNPSTTAKECIQRCLKESGFKEDEFCNFQMWVKTSSDDPAYPLIGHEYPYAIKMNKIRDLFVGNVDNEELQNNINNNVDTRISFILRKINEVKSPTADTLKKSKKTKRTTIINWPPILSKLNTSRQQSSDSFDSGVSNSLGLLFGVDLCRLCDDADRLPSQVMVMLRQLFLKGPFTVGIFRKSANARLCREIRGKLDAGVEVDLENTPITVLASLLKEFLRNLPHCVLLTKHYEDWLSIHAYTSESDQIYQIRRILSKLPKSNVLLLQHFICVLYFIAQKSSENMMSASNLAICVGPSLLTPCANATYSSSPTESSAKQIPFLIEFLINNCTTIFGQETLTLFGEAPERDPCRQDSGTEESDSLHCMQERRDDSSIDSLEREFLGESSPKLRSSNRNKMSLSNLSRDSGLTLSDTQLYTPDEEVDSEAGGSSNGGDSALSPAGKSYPLSARSVPHLNTSGLEHQDYQQSTMNEVAKKRTVKSCQRLRTNSTLNNPEAIYDVPKYTRVYSDLNTQTRLNSGFANKNSAQIQSNQDIAIKRRVKRLSSVKVRPISSIETCDDSTKENVYRCVSEESLLNPYSDYSSSLNGKRPVTHRKGRAPAPPANEEEHPKPPARVSRSRKREKVEWKRSQSTPRLDGHKLEEPPSYHEALCRRTILNRFQTPPTEGDVSEQQRQEQTIASKHAKDIYEESLKQYSKDSTVKHPKSEVEHYYSKVSSVGKIKEHSGLHRSTSEGLHLKLQHLPPVHLKSDSKLSRGKRLSSQKESNDAVGKPVNVKYQVHEYSIYDDRKDIRCSVAKLRQLFTEKTTSNSSLNRQNFNPPPYRPPPPAAKQYGSKDCASFLHKPVVILRDLPNDMDDNFGEESYV